MYAKLSCKLSDLSVDFRSSTLNYRNYVGGVDIFNFEKSNFLDWMIWCFINFFFNKTKNFYNSTLL